MFHERKKRVPRQKSTHVDDPARVGARLREARERAGLSQRALSFPGCTPAYISRIEAGQRIPSLQLLREFGRRLGVTADYLATGTESGDETDRLVDAAVALRLDDLDLAERVYAEALDGAVTPQERRRAHAGLGQVALRRGDAAAALEHLEYAVGGDDLDDPAGVEALGRAYAASGEYERSIALYERWLEEMKQREDRVQELRLSVLLADALIEQGSLERASELLGPVIAQTDDSADLLTRARLYWSQSRAQARRTNAPLAARYARRAFELLEATDDAVSVVRGHHLLAFVELEQGNPTDALRLLRRGRELLDGHGGKAELARLRLEEARALAELGEREEAGVLATETTALLSDVDPAEAGRAYELLADVFAQLGERERARELYERAIDALERGGGPYVTDAYVRLAELLKADGKTDEALELLEKAVGARQPTRRPI